MQRFHTFTYNHYLGPFPPLGGLILYNLHALPYTAIRIHNSNFHSHLCQGVGLAQHHGRGPLPCQGYFLRPPGGSYFHTHPVSVQVPAPETIFFGHLGVTFTAGPVPAAIYSSLLPRGSPNNLRTFKLLPCSIEYTTSLVVSAVFNDESTKCSH